MGLEERPVELTHNLKDAEGGPSSSSDIIEYLD